MTWVLVFSGIAVAGLIMVIAWAVWLAHKAGDLFSEVGMLGTRVEEAAALVSSLKLPTTSQD